MKQMCVVLHLLLARKPVLHEGIALRLAGN